MYIGDFRRSLEEEASPAARILLDILDKMNTEDYRRVTSDTLRTMTTKLQERNIKPEGAQEGSSHSCPIAAAQRIIFSTAQQLRI